MTAPKEAEVNKTRTCISGFQNVDINRAFRERGKQHFYVELTCFMTVHKLLDMLERS